MTYFVSNNFNKAKGFLSTISDADRNRVSEEVKKMQGYVQELDPQSSKYNTLTEHRKGVLESKIDGLFSAIQLKLNPPSSSDILQAQVNQLRELMGQAALLSPFDFFKQFKKCDSSVVQQVSRLVWMLSGCPDEMQFSEKLLKKDTSILKNHELSKLGAGDGTLLQQIESDMILNHQITEAKKHNQDVTHLTNGKVQFFIECAKNKWFTPIQLEALFEMMHPAVQERIRLGGIRPPLFGNAIDPGLTYDQLQRLPRAVKTKIFEFVWLASGCPRQANFSEELLKSNIGILNQHFPSLLGGNAGTILEQVAAELELNDQLTQGHNPAHQKVQFFQDCLKEIKLTHYQMKSLYKLMHPAVQVQLNNLGIQPPFYGRGFNPELYQTLGAHYNSHTGRTTFRVYAPNAQRIVLNLTAYGEVKHWHDLHKGADGVWTVETDQAAPGRTYHFMVTQKDRNYAVKKVDPFAFQNHIHCAIVGQDNHESVVTDIDKNFAWSDNNWMTHRSIDPSQQPLTIYEVHAPSWILNHQHQAPNWRELAPKLADYCKENGYNAIELMALFAHPQPISMGYQITNFFAPNSHMGTWEDFQFFVNEMHNRGIFVFADWVPAHFALDEFALTNFDGTPLVEDDNPSIAWHPEWGTKVFDFKKQFTKDFLTSNADFLLGKMHLDGLRVDAVASMLYLNYGRQGGQKRHNKHGEEVDLDAKNYLRNLNNYLHGKYHDALIMAEESSAFPNVTRSPDQKGEFNKGHGIGFDLTWHMGFMNDTLKYWQMSSHERSQSYSLFTSTVQAVDGNSDIRPRGKVVLAYSHDENANAKATIFTKMSGDNREQKFANGRLALSYQLLRGGGPTLDFMGTEFLQSDEWHGRLKNNLDGNNQPPRPSTQWEELDPSINPHEHNYHRGARESRKDLNHLFLNSPGLWDQTDHGFSWINATDSANGVVGFHRRSKDDKQQFACIFNTSNRDIADYMIPLPSAEYSPELLRLTGVREVYNTDHVNYGGQGRTNHHVEVVRDHHGRPTHFKLRLPPFTAIVLEEYFS